jgi:hypothetical protein
VWSDAQGVPRGLDESFLFLAILAAPPVHTAVFRVTSAANNGGGTLRQAITNANGSAGADTNCFSIGPGLHTIDLTSPLPQITEAMTIDGPELGADGTCGPETIELADPALKLGEGVKVVSLHD